MEAVGYVHGKNVRWTFATPETVHYRTETDQFSSFCTHSGNRMIKKTPKYHFAIRCVRAITFIGTLVSRNTLVSQRFACIHVAKCSKTLPNIILGLMEAVGYVHAKNVRRNLGTPETVHYRTETH